MEFCGMKREIDWKCLNHARVHANAQSFDRCEYGDTLRPPHTSRFFVGELQIFCRAQICRDISLPHTS